MVAQRKIIGIPDSQDCTGMYILKFEIHAFKALRFWNTVKSLESKELRERESARVYQINGVE